MQFNEIGNARGVYLRVLLNGIAIAGALDAEVGQSDHQIAGWFRISLALGADPAITGATLSSAIDLQAEIQVGISGAGLPQAAASWASLITGVVDTVTLDLVEGVAQISGRDFSSLFIDTLSAETFANQTASEIAQTLATRHDLSPIITATNTPVGRYYADGHALFSLHQSHGLVTEWDLLCGLAEREGFDLFVQNRSLYFAPPAENTPPTRWQWRPANLQASTLTSLQLERSLLLARDLSVTVQSWNSRQGVMVSETVHASTRGATIASSSRRSSNVMNYVFIRPNLSSSAALTFATNALANLSRHERVVTATMPGDLSTAPRGLVTLEGTGTDFDQTYLVDEIVRHISLRSGFIQTVRAVNTPLQSM